MWCVNRGRERGGRGGITVIHILMAPQYLNNSHVLRNNVNRHSMCTSGQSK